MTKKGIKIRIDYLLCILAFVFWAFVYPYHILFTEQLSLFLYSADYWREYALQPGGWAAYSGNFLAQFYISSWAGAAIQTALFAVLLVISNTILTKTGAKGVMTLIAFLPALWLWALQCDNNFVVGDALMFISPFALTLLYISITNATVRRLSYTAAIIPVYLFSGAAATCSLYAALVIYELLFAKDKWKYFTPAWLCVAILLPRLWQHVYLMPDDVLFQILTYQVVDGIKIVPVMLFAFIPFCLLIFRIRIKFTCRRHLALLTSKIFAFTILVGFFGYGYYLFAKAFNRLEEQQFKMYFAVSQNQWDKVLKTAERVKKTDHHTAYFTNLALSMQGQLPQKMFHFSQTDGKGLLLFREWDEFNLRYGSDFFYHVGILNEAIRWIYDAHKLRGRGMDYHTLKRLALWNKEGGYDPIAAKYFDILENTLMYRRWAKLQRVTTLPEKNENQMMINFYIGHIFTIVNLWEHYENNPENDILRDILLCYFLLDREFQFFLDIYDNFPNSPDVKIPQIYQEALLLIGTMGGDITNDPIDMSNEKRFQMFADIANRRTNRSEAELKEKFGDTWWYYYWQKMK